MIYVLLPGAVFFIVREKPSPVSQHLVLSAHCSAPWEGPCDSSLKWSACELAGCGDKSGHSSMEAEDIDGNEIDGELLGN